MISALNKASRFDSSRGLLEILARSLEEETTLYVEK